IASRCIHHQGSIWRQCFDHKSYYSVIKYSNTKKAIKMNYNNIARYAITLILSCSTLFASAQLSGVKTIDKTGSGANNYTSFQAAFNALNTQGVAAPGVTFLVAGGTGYVEDPLVLTATGTAAAPIVFKKFGGATNAVIYSSKNGTKN